MNDMVCRLTDALQHKLFVEMEASGRHVHLSKADALALFGHDLTRKSDLSQPGQYVCNERVTLQSEKGKLERVAVLGPCRGQTQVELSLTDAVTLGITPPVRLSGDLRGAVGVKVIGELGEAQGQAIVAMRHMHMHPSDARQHGLQNGDTVSIRALTDRPTIFEDVPVRVDEHFSTRVHLDYDEANACHFRKGDLGLILYE